MHQLKNDSGRQHPRLEELMGEATDSPLNHAFVTPRLHEYFSSTKEEGGKKESFVYISDRRHDNGTQPLDLREKTVLKAFLHSASRKPKKKNHLFKYLGIPHKRFSLLPPMHALKKKIFLRSKDLTSVFTSGGIAILMVY